jgi:hypothetical protein
MSVNASYIFSMHSTQGKVAAGVTIFVRLHQFGIITDYGAGFNEIHWKQIAVVIRVLQVPGMNDKRAGY